jgi:DNA excision repair protein ERCC-2
MPSYSIMEALGGLLRQSIGSRNILVETRNLSNLEADRLMLSFKSTPGTVLLAVQGGRFSEGEDFPGDQMDASVVVGLSLPPPSPVMYAEYAHTRLAKHDTYLTVSLLPAVRKAIQSAGRHIRSPEKKGMIFLLDSRFNDTEVMKIVPIWLKHNLLTGNFEPNDLRRIIGEFWSR